MSPEGLYTPAIGERSLDCDSHLQCALSCTVDGSCCDQACSPCDQVYRVSDLDQVLARHKEVCDGVEFSCAPEVCATDDRTVIARCVDGQCASVVGDRKPAR